MKNESDAESKVVLATEITNNLNTMDLKVVKKEMMEIEATTQTGEYVYAMDAESNFVLIEFWNELADIAEKLKDGKSYRFESLIKSKSNFYKYTLQYQEYSNVISIDDLDIEILLVQPSEYERENYYGEARVNLQVEEISQVQLLSDGTTKVVNHRCISSDGHDVKLQAWDNDIEKLSTLSNGDKVEVSGFIMIGTNRFGTIITVDETVKIKKLIS